MEAELAAEVSIIMACYSLLVQIADKICAHTYSRFLEINNLYEKITNIIEFFLWRVEACNRFHSLSELSTVLAVPGHTNSS